MPPTDPEQGLSTGRTPLLNLHGILRSRAALTGLSLGVVLFVAVLAYQGIDDVADALHRAGWGIIAIALLHLPPLWADAMGWRT
ncbi:MAG TPA: hypothetical protein VMH06_06100, partial [Thermodesulfovibrionales bacterium]|nr:hypothetical protein [Thermodesulfovibrionales bacterium]